MRSITYPRSWITVCEFGPVNEDHKRASVGAELKAIVSCQVWVLRTELVSFARVLCILNHHAISLSPHLIMFNGGNTDFGSRFQRLQSIMGARGRAAVDQEVERKDACTLLLLLFTFTFYCVCVQSW